MERRPLGGAGGSSPRDQGGGGGAPRFPELPILNLGERPASTAAQRGQREKYGSLFYLGIAGLVVLVSLIGWFGHGLWSNRDIWADVFALNDATRPETDRLNAALRLARNLRLDDSPRMEMALRKDLPALARYMLAESVSTDLVAVSPRSFAMTVARSEGWPDWLRLLLARRLAYGAGRGYDIPREPLDELQRHADPMIGLWATYALAEMPHGDPDPVPAGKLAKAANGQGAIAELAARLRAALVAPEDERERRLDEATEWLRRHHPQAAELWREWGVQDQRVVPEPAR